MQSKDLRQSYIDYFKRQGHTFVPSSSLVPKDDPTLLFTNAGMNQFKDVFLGKGHRPYTRAVNSQKCMRVAGKHNDLEEVGRDGSHHTYFEMLGNWSFGDYFKKEAIVWAWEYITKSLKLNRDRLYVTVHKSDDEAEGLWKKYTDVIPTHIERFGDKENFWEMGEIGPCGPCSEIHYDLGEAMNGRVSAENRVNGASPRFMEIWNLVFMQFERQPGGKLIELPAKHVDTGMGFERICSVVQGKTSNYETDVFQPLIREIVTLSGTPYLHDDRGTPHRVIADHIRSLAFTIADGAMPSNEGAGYVIRRILRRALRFGRSLGLREPFFHKLVPVVAEIYGGFFGELRERREHIRRVILSEEERFLKTLDFGLTLLSEEAGKLRSTGNKVLAGETAFKLYDTYGFPPDLTALILREQGLSMDHAGFEKHMEEQRSRARASSHFQMNLEGGDDLEGVAETKFLGYDQTTATAKLMKTLDQGEHHLFIFDQTPFYAEKGGQVGDRGAIRFPDGRTLAVCDTREKNGVALHCVRKSDHPEAVPFYSGEKVSLAIDTQFRRRVQRNHSATHLLHAALKEVLGAHVEQAGSLVSEDRLRFDFSHPRALTDEEKSRLETIVNRAINDSLTTITKVMAPQEAKQAGAVALFGEKYGEKVRVVAMGEFSKELCGGTHVLNSSEIGVFKIVSESSIAANVRRIEAKSSQGALEYLQEFKETVDKLCQMTKCPQPQIVARIEALQKENRELGKELQRLRGERLASSIEDWLKERRPFGDGMQSFAVKLEGVEPESLRELAATFLARSGEGGVLLASVVGEAGHMACAFSPRAVKNGCNAGAVIRKLAELAGGRGGGKPDSAAGGFKEPSKADLLVEEFFRVVGAGPVHSPVAQGDKLKTKLCEFVRSHRGHYGHEEWLSLLRDSVIRESGVPENELGLKLEAEKAEYWSSQPKQSF